MDGIININKPAGMTSHDVVDYIRKTLRAKKVGHTGTLDPQAEGVLPICIGKATKLAQYISGTSKTYKGSMKIGAQTDTQDATGKIIFKKDVSHITKEDLKEAFSKFQGEIDQTPPMYSAVKYKGKRLYKLARQGINVERKAKKIIIYYFQYKDFVADTVFFEVKTSPGTYVRTLCDEVGQMLGCGAHLLTLTRLNVGHFDIQQSISLDELKSKYKNGHINDILYPIELATKKYLINPHERGISPPRMKIAIANSQ